jgi:hypothetical protein
LTRQLLISPTRVALSIIIMLILGVSLYMSPLRGNAVAAVGVFAILNAVVVTLMATLQVEVVNLDDELTSNITVYYDQKRNQTPCFPFSPGNVSKSASFLPETNMLIRNVRFSRIQTTFSSAHTVLQFNRSE